MELVFLAGSDPPKTDASWLSFGRFVDPARNIAARERPDGVTLIATQEPAHQARHHCLVHRPFIGNELEWAKTVSACISVHSWAASALYHFLGHA